MWINNGRKALKLDPSLAELTRRRGSSFKKNIVFEKQQKKS